jgi:nucleotide-binding universal stress UspA family protein
MPEQQQKNDEIALRIALAVGTETRAPEVSPQWRSLIIENSIDPARDINNLALETGTDLIVLKARKGILSAFHYGSIVERVVSGAGCPVLILPYAFLENESAADELRISQVLLDYDFSRTAARLLPYALRFSSAYHAKLHLLTVLAPPEESGTLEMAQTAVSRRIAEAITLEKLQTVVSPELQKAMPVLTTIRWGRHTDEVIEYSRSNNIDLICTGLPRPYFYFEKIYSMYLGRLLQAATCPVLVLQSQRFIQAAETGPQRAKEIFN